MKKVAIFFDNFFIWEERTGHWAWENLLQQKTADDDGDETSNLKHWRENIFQVNLFSDYLSEFTLS